MDSRIARTPSVGFSRTDVETLRGHPRIRTIIDLRTYQEVANGVGERAA